MTALKEILEKMASQVKPENIDWGYCIPDCGECCNVGLTIPHEDAQKIAKSFGVSINDIFNLPNGSLRSGYTGLVVINLKAKCDLQYSYHLCSIHGMNERYEVCKTWLCGRAEAIRGLNAAGCDIASKLREDWLRQLKSGYNRENWLTFAETQIEIAKMSLDDKVSDEKTFETGEIIALGKKENLYFVESCSDKSRRLSVWQKNIKDRNKDKKIGIIEVTIDTRETKIKDVPQEYRLIADYVEYVFKTTKCKGYPMEFVNSLDKI